MQKKFWVDVDFPKTVQRHGGVKRNMLAASGIGVTFGAFPPGVALVANGTLGEWVLFVAFPYSRR